MPPLTEVAKHLLIINVLVFLADQIFHLDILALQFPGSDRFYPFQLATYFFMHGDLFHLFFNMFALWFFGSKLEILWGPKRFLFFYFVCALGAAFFHYGIDYLEAINLQHSMQAFQANPSYNTFWGFFNETNLGQNPANKDIFRALEQGIRAEDTSVIARAYEEMQSYYNAWRNTKPGIVGASGAIFGLLLAFGVNFPNDTIHLLIPPISLQAKIFVPLLMIIELTLGMNQQNWDNIAHYAHIGGAITGIFVILYWQKFGSRFK